MDNTINDVINNKQTLYSTQTVMYSFVAGYMVSQSNMLGFALGCGFMFALQHMPENIKKIKTDMYNKIIMLLN